MTTIGKIDTQAFAREAAELAGLKPSQAPGLALLFSMVERAGFAAGVNFGRKDYGTDSTELYFQYRTGVTPLLESPPAADAVDPSAADLGMPTTRDEVSF